MVSENVGTTEVSLDLAEELAGFANRYGEIIKPSILRGDNDSLETASFMIEDEVRTNRALASQYAPNVPGMICYDWAIGHLANVKRWLNSRGLDDKNIREGLGHVDSWVERLDDEMLSVRKYATHRIGIRVEISQ